MGNKTDAYRQFVEGKIRIAEEQGAAVDAVMHPSLMGHQKVMVDWALRNGRGLIAAAFGLGKSRVQCQIAQTLHAQTGGKFLLVCPLGVRHQFTTEDGPAMGMEWQYVRSDAEVAAATSPYLITNYERVRDGGIDPCLHELCGVSLDEGSCLRSLGSKTWETFNVLFESVSHRYVCTATPSPNNFRELIYYAQFLGVMDIGQALTRFFMRNPDKAGDLRLIPQEAHNFWMWVASWALFLFAPSDLGFSDEGYALPELRVHWHCVTVDQERAQELSDDRGQLQLLIGGDKTSVRDDARERRATLDARLQKMQEILAAEPERHCLLWHHLEDERRAIQQAIPGAVAVYGSQELEQREQSIVDFTHGKFQYLATKPEIAGSGCNFQRHCSMNVFLGVNYKFQEFIQAIHRVHRFLQSETVDVHIIYAETQQGIVKTLKEKWAQHTILSKTMREIVCDFGLSHEALRSDLRRHIGVARREVQGTRFTFVHNDCVDEIRRLADNSVQFIHTSIPFGNHYEYTTNYEDFGHNPSDEAFFAQMDFLIPELLRVLEPGRIAAIHVKDRQLYGHQTASGFMECGPFSDETVLAFRRHGWLYGGRITVVTDVVRENNSTYRLGWSEMCKDGSKMSVGLPEYVLLFRKAPTDATNHYADSPVTHSKAEYSCARWQIDAHSFWRSKGDVLPYDYWEHVARNEAKERLGHLPKIFFDDPPQSGSPWVWDDVLFMRCLNARQTRSGKVKHLCPLATDIIERCIERFTNPDDVVFEPFGGIGSVPYMAVKMGRRGYAVELNEDYFGDGVKYCQEAEIEYTTPRLFDEIEAMGEPDFEELETEAAADIMGNDLDEGTDALPPELAEVVAA